MRNEREIKFVEEPFLPERAKRIEYVEENGCHICVSHAKAKGGYPKLKRNGKLLTMSRYIYELHYGKIPEGLVVRHKCDNPLCINPEHLELGKQIDNMRDKYERGRANHKAVRGENAGCAKLTENDVREIITLLKAGKSQREIAKRFKVSQNAIYLIKNGKSWTHITGGAIS